MTRKRKIMFCVTTRKVLPLGTCLFVVIMAQLFARYTIGSRIYSRSSWNYIPDATFKNCLPLPIKPYKYIINDLVDLKKECLGLG